MTKKNPISLLKYRKLNTFYIHTEFIRIIFINIFIKVNCLKNFGGVTEIFTETVLHTSYLFCAKSLSGSSSSKFTSFSLWRRELFYHTTSFLKSVFFPTLNGSSIHIYNLLVILCSGSLFRPENAADFVSTIFRDTDWVLTSQFKVIISLMSDNVVKATSMHSIIVLSLLSSSSFEDLSIYVMLL